MTRKATERSVRYNTRNMILRTEDAIDLDGLEEVHPHLASMLNRVTVRDKVAGALAMGKNEQTSLRIRSEERREAKVNKVAKAAST